MDTSYRRLAKLLALWILIVSILITIILLFAFEDGDFNGALFGAILCIGTFAFAMTVTIGIVFCSKAYSTRISRQQTLQQDDANANMNTTQPLPTTIVTRDQSVKEYMVVVEPDDRIVMARGSNDMDIVIVHNP